MYQKDKYKNVNRIFRIILNSAPFILATITFLCVRFAVNNPGSVEKNYSSGIYPVIAKIISTVSNLFSFSLWDVFWVLIILLAIFGLFLVILKKLRFLLYGMRIVQLLALLYSIFYFGWGFNYFRPAIETRIGWEKQITGEETFRSVLDSIIIKTNLSFTPILKSDFKEIDRLVEESYLGNRQKLGINYPNGTRRPKTMLFSFVYAKFGVSGYFGPFFNEVHLNSNLLPMEYPYILAHEKAHQFGIASEAEANLAAYIVCTTSDDKRLKYSGNLYLLLYFIKDAVYMKDFSDYFKKIDDRVIIDLRARRSYYEALQNETLGKVQAAANNAYLKTNHIERGVKNYNQVVSLVISWYLNNY